MKHDIDYKITIAITLFLLMIFGLGVFVGLIL